MKLLPAVALMAWYGVSLFSYPTDWSPGAAIPPGASGTLYGSTVSLVYDASSHQMIAAWVENTSQAPFYAVFDGTAWSTGATIPMGMSGSVYDSVYQTYNSQTGEVFAAWSDGTNPWYSIYDGNSWTDAAQIPLGPSVNVGSNVFLAYDSVSNQVVAAWADYNFEPFVAYHDGMRWVLTEAISLGMSSGVDYDVTVCFNSADNQMFAAWGDLNNLAPYASRRVGGMWMTSFIPVIPPGSAPVYSNINLAYDSVANQVFSAWVSDNNTRVFYSIFSSGAWSNAALINHGASPGANLDAYLAFDSNSNAMYIGWSDTGMNLPYYSVYSGGAWSAGAAIPLGASAGAGNNVFPAYNSGQLAMFAAWDDSSFPSFPYWSSTQLAPLSSRPPNFRRPYSHRAVSQTISD